MIDDSRFVSLALIDVLGLTGIVVWHIQGRYRPTARLITQIIFFTGMTVLLALNGIWPHSVAETDGQGARAIISKTARVLWWTHLAWAIIGFMNIYLAVNRRPREARLIHDLIVALAYLGVVLSIVGFVFGAPVGALVATSGVVAVILGLALQNTLGDVFSGIALTLGRPYIVGDWIALSDGTEGRVVETNWRSTNLLTSAHNVVVLPNSVLAKSGLTNFSRPDETHQIALRVRIATTEKPEFVVSVMESALRASEQIAKGVPSGVALQSIDAMAIEVELSFRVASPSRRSSAKNEVIALIYRHCQEKDLHLAPSSQSAIDVWRRGQDKAASAASLHSVHPR
ncbi:mechanosensitive ion channel family protein [Labrys neptuniae]